MQIHFVLYKLCFIELLLGNIVEQIQFRCHLCLLKIMKSEQAISAVNYLFFRHLYCNSYNSWVSKHIKKEKEYTVNFQTLLSTLNLNVFSQVQMWESVSFIRIYIHKHKYICTCIYRHICLHIHINISMQYLTLCFMVAQYQIRRKKEKKYN